MTTLPTFALWPLATAPSPQAEDAPFQVTAEVVQADVERLPRRAIVFIHGIFSDHEKAFREFRKQMASGPLFETVQFYYFDYAYWESMEVNGRRLAEELCKLEFQEDDSVAIIAHSMGGLVARLAILSTRMNFIRILFLLGTPNAGAIRLSQLTPLLHLLHRVTNQFFAQRPQWDGIVSLSNAAQILEQRRNGNATDIDYVSIPGCYFHKDRNVWDVQNMVSGMGFSALESIFLRRLAIRMDHPHDGIVEESSNNMMRCPRSTEKIDSYGGTRGESPATYAHLFLKACNEVNHVTIHSAPDIIAIVRELIAAKFNLRNEFRLRQWFTLLPPSVRIEYGIQIQTEN